MHIHEKENWTNFVWDNDRLSPNLASVRYLQGRLLGRMESLGFDFIERATIESLILDVVDTSRIEGEILNPELVRSSIARKLGIENANFVKTPRNIEGIVDVILDATQNFDQPLTKTRLLGWHNSLFQTGFSGYQLIDVAKYRSGGMKVVSGNFGREKIHFEAPSAERVPYEMEQFLNWLNSDNSLDLPNETRSFAKKSKSIETGRVEKGGKSNTELKSGSGDYSYFISHSVTWKLLPNSQKPVEVSDLRNYCSGCGVRIKKANWKFCPTCGNEI
jgi:hypothetical protein